MIDPKFLAQIIAEVEAGLPNEKGALDEARENQAFFDLDGERYVPMREAETTLDWERREKRTPGFTRECIEVLTEDLYNPGPSRMFSEPEAEEFLEKVWEQNDFDALQLEADQLAHLNRACAFQLDAGDGVFADKPIALRLWGRDEFVAWEDPDDCQTPLAVCTIDRHDQQSRYRLWTDSDVREFITQKADGTSGGVVAVQVKHEPHDYGRVPFAFHWYSHPTRCFLPSSPGTFLRQAEVRISDRLSRLDESINKQLNKVPYARNVVDGWQPVIEPNRFIILRNPGPKMGPAGFEPSKDPEIGFLDNSPNVQDAWHDLERYLNQVLEAVHVPASAIRMIQRRSGSGFELLVEQSPLLKRARKRRAVAGYCERGIAAAILECAGNHYGRPGLVAAAKSGKLTLGWCEPIVPIPSLDRTRLDEADVAAGYLSRLQVIQRRSGCTRDQAVKILKQIAEDKALEATIGPLAAPGPGDADGTPAEGSGSNADAGTDTKPGGERPTPEGQDEADKNDDAPSGDEID